LKSTNPSLSTTQPAVEKAKTPIRRYRVGTTDRLAYLLLAPTFLLFIGVLLAPTVFNFYTSFQDWVLFGETSKFIGWDNYRDIFNDPRYLATIWRTLLFVVLTVGLQFFIGFAVALMLDRYLSELRGVQIIFLLPMMISEVAAALAWRLLFVGQYSFLNWLIGLMGFSPQVWLGPDLAFVSVLLVEVWMHTPFVILLIFAALQGVPQELVEAGKLDGAGAWANVRHIIFPLIQPAVLVVLMFRTMFALRAFGTIWTLTHGGPANRTTVIGIDIYQQAFVTFDLGVASALSVLLTVLCAVISILYIRMLSREALS
jgi:multiple sugar transport system permease protein